MIGIGGALGSMARFGFSALVQRSTDMGFPVGTMAVNIAGCFLIGFLAELFENILVPPQWRSFATIGFLGGFTTFSTFSLETINMLREGENAGAIMNVVISNILGVLSVAAGILTYRLFRKMIGGN
jgi:CrcB protein